MATELTIQKVLQDKNSYNLAIPFTQSQQINPYYRMSVSLLMCDTSDEAGQIFKVGSKKVDERFEDVYSLTKPFLMKLATEAGIQFSPNSGDVTKVDQNTWKASAFGAIKLPDGTVRTSQNFKVIDLQTEEQKLRLGYQDKAERGISDWRSAKAAAAEFKGTWKETGEVDRQGYKVKVFYVDPAEKSKYIERSLLDAMTQLRANAPQKAATGAILRVIRDLTGVKGTYTKAELQKPFAVARMSFSPDYSDPVVKQMMLQSCMNSIGNLFGIPQAAVQQTIVAQPDDEDSDIYPSLPEPSAAQTQQNNREIAEPQQEGPDEDGLPWNSPQDSEPARYSDPITQAKESVKGPTKAKPETRTKAETVGQCSKCGAGIDKSVLDYSQKHFGRPLCFKCQREEKK